MGTMFCPVSPIIGKGEYKRVPNRIIRESCRTSKSLDALSKDLRAEAFFWRLVTVADDYGRFLAEPKVMLSTCFPCRPKTVTETDVGKWMQMLTHANIVKFYEISGTSYGVFLNWQRHQGTPRAKVSKYPEPPDPADICEHLPANVLVSESESVSENRESKSVIGNRTSVPSPRRQVWESWQPEDDLKTWAVSEGVKPDDLGWIVEEFKLYWLDLPDKKLPKRPDLTFRHRILLLKGKGLLGQFRRGVDHEEVKRKFLEATL